MNANVIYLDLPCTIKAMTVREYDDDEYYTIVLNSHLSLDANLTSYVHELEHIEHDDFSSDVSADTIECVRHR